MIVIDASVIVELLLHRPAARKIEERLFDRRSALHAPHLIDIEIVHSLRRYAMLGEIDGDCGRNLLDLLDAFPLHRHPHALFLSRVWDLRHNFTAYDAVYVALAEALDATLLTRDRHLATAAEAVVAVELA